MGAAAGRIVRDFVVAVGAAAAVADRVVQNFVVSFVAFVGVVVVRGAAPIAV